MFLPTKAIIDIVKMDEIPLLNYNCLDRIFILAQRLLINNILTMQIVPESFYILLNRLHKFASMLFKFSEVGKLSLSSNKI